jgi:hypothetical protein
MKSRGFISLKTLLIVVAIVGALAYFEVDVRTNIDTARQWVVEFFLGGTSED